MNILVFNFEYPPLGGGGGVAAAVIAEELARRHRVVVVTSHGRGLPKVERVGGVEIRRLPVLGRDARATASLRSMVSYVPSAWWSALNRLSTQRFDVLHAHFAVPTGVASLPVAKLSGLPHVLTILGGDIYDPSKRLSPHRLPGVRLAVSQVMKRSDRVIADSTNTRDNAYRYYAYQGPIEIIPLGIRPPDRWEASRRALGLPEDRFLAITVGRLVKRKAVHRLLHAISALPDSVFLIVVGTGPEEAELCHLASTLGIENRVQFTGFVDEHTKWRLLACSDAYVSASMHEGFGLVYLEAMAMGLPVIAPDHGGQMDFLVDGRTGLIFPVGDDQRLVESIGRLLEDPERRARMGERNRRSAERFEADNCARAYEEVFRRVTSGTTRSGSA